MLERLRLIAFILLFIWVSFFSLPVGSNQQFLFFSFIFVILILLCIKEKKYKLIFNKAEIPFFLFFSAMIVGIARVNDLSVAYWHFWFFILPMPFIYFFAKLSFDNKYGIFIMRSACVMAALVFIFGIIEFITKRNFIYSGLVYNFCYEAFKGRRMMSTHIHPAPLGTYFVAILPLAVGLLFLEKKTIFKLAAGIYIIFISIGTILTFSRGALLGALAGGFILTANLLKDKKRIVIFCSILAVLALIITASSLLYYSGYLQFQRYSMSGLSQQHSYLAKIFRFEMAIRLLKEHPFVGAGLGHYRVLFDYYVPPNLPPELMFDYSGKVADCMFMTILAETGLIGFGSFLFFLFLLFKKVKTNLVLISGQNAELSAFCFLSGLIGILCTFFTYDGLYWPASNYLFWCYAGILASSSRRQSA